MKKQIQFLTVSALVLGLSACGGNDQPVPPPQTNYQIPNQPNSGAFNNVNKQAVANLQKVFGNITTNRSTVLGNQTLPQGTHSWQTVYNKLEAAAKACTYCQQNNYWGGYSYTGGMSNIDMNAFREYLKMEIIDNTDVKYANDPSFTYSMAHTVDQLLSIMNQSYGYMANYWGYSGYPTYSYPTYGYPQNGLSVGVGYSGGNLNFGLNYSNW